VPVLGRAQSFDVDHIDCLVTALASQGSSAVPGFANPEGVVIFHTAGNVMFKRLIDNDDIPKSLKGGGVMDSYAELSGEYSAALDYTLYGLQVIGYIIGVALILWWVFRG
jgi:hypothetical protein